MTRMHIHTHTCLYTHRCPQSPQTHRLQKAADKFWASPASPLASHSPLNQDHPKPRPRDDRKRHSGAGAVSGAHARRSRESLREKHPREPVKAGPTPATPVTPIVLGHQKAESKAKAGSTPATPVTPILLGHQKAESKAKGQQAKSLKRVLSLSSGSKFYTHVIMQRAHSEEKL